jgi:aconitate hydratase
MLPFITDADEAFDYSTGDYIFVPNIRQLVEGGAESVDASVITASGVKPLHLSLPGLTAEEREIISAGCLMNWYARRNK